MKRLLLSLFLTIGTLSVQAQLVQLISLGATIGTNAALGRYSKKGETATATEVYYQKKIFKQQRTPADKLPLKGGTDIAQMEALLQQCHTIFTADSVTEIVGPEQFRAFADLKQQIRTRSFSWNTRFYEEEMAFYQQQDHVRRQRREQQAQQLTAGQAPALQLREQHRLDSLAAANRPQPVRPASAPAGEQVH